MSTPELGWNIAHDMERWISVLSNDGVDVYELRLMHESLVEWLKENARAKSWAEYVDAIRVGATEDIT